MGKIDSFIKELKNTQTLEQGDKLSYAGISETEGLEVYRIKLESLYEGFTTEFIDVILRTDKEDREHIGDYTIERLNRCHDKEVLIMPSPEAIKRLRIDADTSKIVEDKKRYLREAEKLAFIHEMILLQREFADKAKKFVVKRCLMKTIEPESDIDEVLQMAGETQTTNNPDKDISFNDDNTVNSSKIYLRLDELYEYGIPKSAKDRKWREKNGLKATQTVKGGKLMFSIYDVKEWIKKNTK